MIRQIGLPKILLLFFIIFSVDSAMTHTYYGKCERHLNVKTGERIGISPLNQKTS